jgi:hypothetical protein
MSDTNSETGVFALCESAAEVFLLTYREMGLEGVARLLDMTAATDTRQGLRRDAAALQRVGLAELAAVLRERARKTKPAPPTLKERHRMAERRSGALPGFAPRRRH